MDDLAKLRADADDFYMKYRIKCDEETKAQQIEIDRLRKHEARYHWLRDNPRGRALSVSAICCDLDPRVIDAAIDAAMEGQ